MKQLPAYFTENLKAIYSAEELKIIEKWFKTENRNTSFRLNPLIDQSSEVLERLTAEWINYDPVMWLENAYVLQSSEDNDKLWKLDIIKRWLIYVHGISSQFPVNLLNIQPWMKILDLAAAPGGKTSHLAARLDNTWEIVAIDNNAIRMDKLQFTLNRQQVKNTKTMKCDARNYHLLHTWDLFDAIIFDTPCSAEWRINLSNEKSYNFISQGNNKKNYRLQKDILKDNIAFLKTGGEFLYSTCTISPLENEAIVHFLLCNFPELEIVDLDMTVFWDFSTKAWLTHYWETAYKKEVSKSIRVLPSTQTEWFFIAKFVKK